MVWNIIQCAGVESQKSRNFTTVQILTDCFVVWMRWTAGQLQNGLVLKVHREFN